MREYLMKIIMILCVYRERNIALLKGGRIRRILGRRV